MTQEEILQEAKEQLQSDIDRGLYEELYGEISPEEALASVVAEFSNHNN